MTTKTLTLAAVTLAVGIAMANAQPAPAQDPHHPGTDGAGTTQAKPVAPPSPQRPTARGPMQPGTMPMQPGGQGMMMGGDMTQMMNMMQMMHGGTRAMGM